MQRFFRLHRFKNLPLDVIQVISSLIPFSVPSLWSCRLTISTEELNSPVSFISFPLKLEISTLRFHLNSPEETITSFLYSWADVFCQTGLTPSFEPWPLYFRYNSSSWTPQLAETPDPRWSLCQSAEALRSNSWTYLKFWSFRNHSSSRRHWQWLIVKSLDFSGTSIPNLSALKSFSHSELEGRKLLFVHRFPWTFGLFW